MGTDSPHQLRRKWCLLLGESVLFNDVTTSRLDTHGRSLLFKVVGHHKLDLTWMDVEKETQFRWQEGKRRREWVWEEFGDDTIKLHHMNFSKN